MNSRQVCDRCGHPNTPSATFCQQCGQKLRSSASHPEHHPGQPAVVTAAPRHVTLLYATEERPLALQFEKYVEAASASMGTNLVVWHNETDLGRSSAEIWPQRLDLSDLFVPLVAASLWTDQAMLARVKHIVSLKPAARILPVWLRPCILDQNKFLGLDVIPTEPVTKLKGGREKGWLLIVKAIFQALDALPLIPPVPPPPLSTFSHPPKPPSRPQMEAPVIASTFDEVPSLAKKKSDVAPKEWEVTVLFAPEDASWFKPIERLFLGLQRVALEGLNITFVLHRGNEGLSEQTEDAMISRVLASRLTLALLSPNFLMSEWMLSYDQIQARLREKKQTMIHVLLKPCQWNRKDYRLIPRRPIGRIGNDAAWQELSEEMYWALETYYPDEIPRRERR